jgi:hypothetical protein
MRAPKTWPRDATLAPPGMCRTAVGHSFRLGKAIDLPMTSTALTESLGGQGQNTPKYPDQRDSGLMGGHAYL